MIPLYDAIEFIKVMEGGSTRPWQVTVNQNGEPVPYVVKLYPLPHNENCTVLKECICSLLAPQFDLETPEIALINFSQPFLDGLKPELRQVLKTRDPRIKFASRLVEPPYENYSPALHNAYLESFDIGSVYAFDNLILNVDRRNDKPNMFFKTGKVVLIDHELTLETWANARNAVLNNSPWTHNYKRHLFHAVLRDMEETHKNHCFDTFFEYLNTSVNFDELDFLPEFLEEHGHPVMPFFDIKDYLCTLKQNSGRFVQLLQNTIQ